MKSFVRFLIYVLLAVFSTAAFAQSEAQKSFTQLKSLAGTWEGKMKLTPPMPEMDGKPVHVTLRVTSMGNVLMHEMVSEGRPDDPITMLYLDDGRLTLTHYCDAGNRPRMVAKTSADGKNVEFDLTDVAGSLKYGHMHHVGFTLGADADHHAEDWMFMLPGDKHVQGHVELVRVK